MIADMLLANGIPAHADEDLGYRDFRPQVWADKSMVQKASLLVRQFDENNRNRQNPASGKSEIQVVCEECGRSTVFAKSQNGAVQECSHCHAYVDVGDLPWTDDFSSPED